MSDPEKARRPLVELTDRIYENAGWLSDYIPRKNLTVATAYWDHRRGVCYGGYRFGYTKRRNFGKRFAKSKYLQRATGHYVVMVNRALVEVSNEKGEWKNTLRHEIAHALQREYFGECQPHGEEFKTCAKLLGAKPKACGGKRPDWLKAQIPDE